MAIKCKYLFTTFAALVLISFLPGAYALGAGDYGFVAYSSPDTVYREVRVSTSKTSTEPFSFSGGGATVYYGTYAKKKVDEWLGSGKTVYLVRVSPDNKYKGLAQITQSLPGQ